MARPSKFNREEAVEVAMNQIWKNGFEASSVKSLSEKLGITRSSFYNAFGSHEDLFREAMEKYFEQSPDSVLSLAGPQVPIKMLLAHTFRQACKARAADKEARGCMVINSVAELCNVNEELGGLVEEAVLASAARFEQLMRWAVERGEIEEDANVRALALSLQNLLMGLNVMCKVVRDEEELWLTARTVLTGLNLYEAPDGDFLKTPGLVPTD